MGPPTILKTWNTRETVARSRYPRKVSLYVCSHLASLPSLGKSLLREVCVRMVQSMLSSNRVNACILSTRVIGKMILISCLSCRKRAEKISFWPCCNRNGEEGRDALVPPTYFVSLAAVAFMGVQDCNLWFLDFLFLQLSFPAFEQHCMSGMAFLRHLYSVKEGLGGNCDIFLLIVYSLTHSFLDG